MEDGLLRGLKKSNIITFNDEVKEIFSFQRRNTFRSIANIFITLKGKLFNFLGNSLFSALTVM